MSAQIFEFAIIHTPILTKEQIDSGTPPQPKLVVPITSILAKDLPQANLLAARAIPDEFMADLSRITIAVRAF